MIPLRVRLKGFLCYKDEQEVSFDGASLWMLSGLNGSGKSSIFDAVTYALFGYHRGGSQQNEELINKNSSEMLVEFEFLQEHQGYYIKRTLRRKKGGGANSSQQIFRRLHSNGNGTAVGDGNGLLSWEPIEGTSTRDGFKEWIEENIGLTYETFTSSVLLLQGKAEKLLDSTAKGRFEVLAGIVDLDRYQRLHGRADDRRRKQDGRVDGLRNRLEGIPEVQPLELLEAEAAITTAEDARTQAEQEVERLQELEFQARQCREVQLRLTGLLQRRREMQGLIDEADRIEKDLTRLQELRLVLPRLKVVIEQHRRIESCDRDLGELGKRKTLVEQELAKHDDSLAKARLRRQTHETALSEDQRKQQTVGQELRTLAEQLTRLKEYERLEQEQTRVVAELKELPADPLSEMQHARKVCDDLQALSRVRPDLERFAALREQLGQSRVQFQEATTARQQIEVRGKQLKIDLDQVKAQLARVEEACKAIDDQTAQARARQEDARRLLSELNTLEGAKVCRVCGQPLTAGHLDAEHKRRQRDLEDADHRLQEAQTRQKTTHAQQRQVREQVQALEKQVAEARDEFRDHKKEAEQAQKEEERLQNELASLFGQLPAHYQTQISPELPDDWTATNYPVAADLTHLRTQAASLSVAQKRQRDAEEVLAQWTRLTAQEKTLHQNLTRLRAELPRDHAGVRVRHETLIAEEKALQKSVLARQQSIRENQQEQEQIGRLREATQKALAETRGKTEARQHEQHLARQTLGREVKELPPDWQRVSETVGISEVSNWNLELDELVEKKTEQRAEQLKDARLAVGGLARELATIEEQVQAFPEAARQDPLLVQGQLQQARTQHRQRDEELAKARQHQHLLDTRHRERETVQADLLQAEGELKHLELLSKILGRDRLQLHLVRQAERQVVDHANAVLDRLSGGELFLKLCGEAGGDGNLAKALELEAHNRTTGEKPINVAFLSGSQKFRVAVSLALGIGQYASRQHRPIESVIIDEGFGCLDRNARQVMIQELQNLRSQMRCILLVSHQEEFADAFAHGYHFELQGGTTVARRFQK